MQASKERIESNGGRATIATGDLRDPAKVQALVEQAARETGRLDIMVNNAGVSLPAPIIDADLEGWREMLGTQHPRPTRGVATPCSTR
jgi:glucose 1-dehydrogenase